MSETKPEEKPKSEQPEETAPPKPLLFDITTQEGRDALFQMRCIAVGVDPKQVQSLAKFSDFDKIDERSYYPNQLTSVAIAQLRMYGESMYRGEDWNEYALCADLLGDGFMGYKGFKSNQYVEITSGQQNLDKLQGIPEEVKKGVLSGLLNRGKSE